MDRSYSLCPFQISTFTERRIPSFSDGSTVIEVLCKNFSEITEPLQGNEKRELEQLHNQ